MTQYCLQLYLEGADGKDGKVVFFFAPGINVTLSVAQLLGLTPLLTILTNSFTFCSTANSPAIVTYYFSRSLSPTFPNVSYAHLSPFFQSMFLMNLMLKPFICTAQMISIVLRLALTFFR